MSKPDSSSSSSSSGKPVAQPPIAGEHEPEFPLWVFMALWNVRREGHTPGKMPLDRLARILGSLEWEPGHTDAGVEVSPSFSGVMVRLRIHPREFELAIPWIEKPRLATRENGRLVLDSLVRNPSVQQLREALRWVDNGFMNRDECDGI